MDRLALIRRAVLKRQLQRRMTSMSILDREPGAADLSREASIGRQRLEASFVPVPLHVPHYLAGDRETMELLDLLLVDGFGDVQRVSFIHLHNVIPLEEHRQT